LIVSDRTLRKKAGKWFPKGLKIGPSSVDLTLGDSFAYPDPRFGGITLGEPVAFKKSTADKWTLAPHRFVLATTQECVDIPDGVAAFVSGRSSIGRLGLQVQNAGFIDAGFCGQITLELANQTQFPIVLIPGVRICQIVFVRQDRRSRNPYSGKYQGQIGATPSRLEQDFKGQPGASPGCVAS
jgi:dCTP deaminase